jgi:glucose/mannose-6-phosphate isomerase
VAVDTTDQRGEALGLAEHLRDSLWRVDSAGLETSQAAGLVIAGMGGSAIGGRLARAVLGDREQRPIVLATGYELPPWVDSEWTVLLSSYSGSTEETLACWDAATAAGARRIVATTGGPLGERAREAGVPVIPIPAGFQPRAAVGYATGIALEVAAAAGVAPSVRDEIEAAADAVAEPPDPSELVAALRDGIPLIVGAELTAPVAYRWKCQVNENANRTAFSGELPEHDHNEIEGWQAPLVPVFLVDPSSHERNLRRFEVTAEVARAAGLAPVTVTADAADTRAERVFRLVLLGDLMSIDLAIDAGTDPVSIPALERVKAELAR